MTSIAKHDRLAAELRAILFPEPIMVGDGGLLIDGSADWNLAAALEDLKHREIDRVCIATIERVLDQLDRTRTLLMKEEQ